MLHCVPHELHHVHQRLGHRLPNVPFWFLSAGKHLPNELHGPAVGGERRGPEGQVCGELSRAVLPRGGKREFGGRRDLALRKMREMLRLDQLHNVWRRNEQRVHQVQGGLLPETRGVQALPRGGLYFNERRVLRLHEQPVQRGGQRR
jgi:hypothetical protein